MDTLNDLNKHLHLMPVIRAPDFSTQDQQSHDKVQQIRNFAQIPFPIPQYRLLPRIFASGNLPAAFKGSQSWKIDQAALLNIFPHMFNEYSYLRFHVKFILQLKATWNHTGLISLSYCPMIGTNIIDNLRTTIDSYTVLDPHTYAFHCPPNFRTFGRVSRDMEMNLTIPWLSPYGAYRHDTGINIAPTNLVGRNSQNELPINTIVPASILTLTAHTTIS